MRRLLLWLTAFASVLALVPGAPVGTPAADAREKRVKVRPGEGLLASIDRHRQRTWRLQQLMGKPRTQTSYTARRSPGHRYRRWVLRLWRKREHRARRQVLNPPRKAAWLCIHRYEAHWHDPHPPYYGGLQMDLTFQQTYGADLLRRKGTADRWTPIEQMWVAERAYRSGRGFYPWPNTARYCGLI